VESLARAGSADDWGSLCVKVQTAMKRLVCLLALGGFLAFAGPIRIRVTSDEMAAKPVNPLLYGNFIESGFGRQVDGMWAEMLFNRSFEPVPPSKGKWLQYGPGEDLTTKPWWHSGYEENRWRLAPGNPEAQFLVSSYWGFHHGKHSANLVNESASRKALLVQDGLYLRPGATYRFRGYLKPGRAASKAGAGVGVTVALCPRGDLTRPLVERVSPITKGPWLEFTAELPNPAYRGRASLVISIAPGTDIFLDDLSLVPADNLGGWRKDVVEGLERVHPTIIRFPGGCYASFFNWRDGVGPRSRRHPRQSDFWGGLEYNDVGTDEFLDLCRRIDAQPQLVVNMMTGTPEQAAEWVAYCNAPASDPMGKLRAANGHREPYGVKYWELDNEPYRKWTVEEYARQCADFSRAMKAVDPEIQLVACGYGPFAHSMAELLDGAGRFIDLVSDRAKGEQHLRDQLRIIGDYNRRTGRSIRLCNTEWLAPWNEVPPDSALPGAPLLDKKIPRQEQQITWRYAMNAARTLLMFQRLGGDFEFANFNNMANTWGQNVIECPKQEAFLSAAGRVFELFSRSPAAWPLKTELPADARDVVAQAAWDRDRKNLVLVILNYRNAEAKVDVDLSALDLRVTSAGITTLQADSLMSYNSSSNHDAVRRTEASRRLSSAHAFSLTVAPYSVTHVILD